MKKLCNFGFILSHVLLAVLVYIILFVPKKLVGLNPTPLLVGIGIVEVLFLANVFGKIRRKQSLKGCADIIIMVWLFFIAWEIASSVKGNLNPVLFPAPENTFQTFVDYRRSLTKHITFSLKLLGRGLFIGVTLAVVLGVICAWIPRLRGFTYPIANVMAPIPPIVFAPYLIVLLSNLKATSLMIVILGVFWPTFMNTFQNVQGLEKRTIDSARMLNLNNAEMIFNILLPAVMPAVLNRFKVTLTTSLLMLNFAEMMGANSGMGYFIINSTSYSNYEQTIAGIICIGVMVTILNKLTTLAQKYLLRWK